MIIEAAFFFSWIQVQLENHPDELWEDGLQDYLSHAKTIMVKIDVFTKVQSCSHL